MAKLIYQFYQNHVPLFLIIFLLFNSLSLAVSKSEEEASECASVTTSQCHDKFKANKLNFIAILTILVSSMIGVSLPLFSKAVPALRPDKDLFILVRSFASGVILATGFMHVMPDSWNDLTSPCLPENPWKVFPFTPFITMISAYGTMMMDSFSTSFYEKKCKSKPQNENVNENIDKDVGDNVENKNELGLGENHGGHGQIVQMMIDSEGSRLLKDRVIAQVLEFGIVVHSVVIGLSMGSSDNVCTIRPLITAICFHQLFEGMGLGGCILQAKYGLKIKAIMVFFFSVTTPFGIILGILLQNVYQENSPTALIVVGILNGVSAGLLIYMALVDLLSSDFKGPKLQGNLKLQICCYVAALLGTGLMSLMAKWA
ncbi:zinc transporter 7 [Beta vulgaris subsp. vulgaris]|uniref:zinc transporter 7 n=1 Tax=Beta vulgaris subsp. vulgaris TaxID=3555 RepID=UPI00053FED06|nr:zinc transporter 7 [Beta vulgaris subsp. vulgaris]